MLPHHWFKSTRVPDTPRRKPHRVSPLLEALEYRRLLSSGPQTPFLSAITDPTNPTSTLLLTYSTPDASALALELRSAGDENFRLIQSSLDNSVGDHQITLAGLSADRRYEFRLRADRDGLTSYVSSAASTLPMPYPSIPIIYATPQNVQLLFDQYAYDQWGDLNWFVGFDGDYSADGGFSSNHGSGELEVFGYGWRVDDPYHVLSSGQVSAGNLDDTPLNRDNEFISGGFNEAYGTTIEARLRVGTLYGSGLSDWSAPFLVTAPGEMASAPDLTSQVVGDKVRVSWGGPTSGYISVYKVVDGVAKIIGLFPVSQGYTDVNPLPAGGRFFATYGNSGYSNFVSGDTVPIVPSAPTNLSVTNTGTQTVNLLWDNTSNNEQGFLVQRKLAEAAVSAWENVATLDADVTFHADTLPGDDPLEWVKEYNWRVLAYNGNLFSASPTTQSSGLYLQSVTFGGWADGGGAVFQSIARDNGNGAYDGAHWMDDNLNGRIDAPGQVAFSNGTLDGGSNEHTFPLSYLRSRPGQDSYISAGPVLAFNGVVGANWQIKGTSDDYVFAPTSVLGGGGFAWSSLNAQQALPQTIASRNLTIVWQLSTNGGTTWFDVGTSNNHLYITGAAASGAYETVLDIGCTSAAGLRPHEQAELEPAATGADRQVADAIWGEFADNSVKRVDGTTMSYSHDPTGFAYVAGGTDPWGNPGMLTRSDGRGQCTAWADLLVTALGAQGVAAISTRIDPPDGFDGFRVRLMAAQGSAGANYLPGTSGLGFSFHQVVTVEVYPDRVYDPSYGARTVKTDTRSAKLKYEDEIIMGFAWFDPITHNTIFDPDQKGVRQLQW